MRASNASRRRRYQAYIAMGLCGAGGGCKAAALPQRTLCLKHAQKTSSKDFRRRTRERPHFSKYNPGRADLALSAVAAYRGLGDQTAMVTQYLRDHIELWKPDYDNLPLRSTPLDEEHEAHGYERK